MRSKLDVKPSLPVKVETEDDSIVYLGTELPSTYNPPRRASKHLHGMNVSLFVGGPLDSQITSQEYVDHLMDATSSVKHEHKETDIFSTPVKKPYAKLELATPSVASECESVHLSSPTAAEQQTWDHQVDSSPMMESQADILIVQQRRDEALFAVKEYNRILEKAGFRQPSTPTPSPKRNSPCHHPLISKDTVTQLQKERNADRKAWITMLDEAREALHKARSELELEKGRVMELEIALDEHGVVLK
ncbi:hypothetical protein DFP72DRAFT_1072123 [Ephemerocybe angulata]|uniref:Uncharacterized protein n=1 Tax=Ephemerocybe angulata TaxID=980116 RepID=A0A8H6HQW6_9AGAR|nr:hypothetical protein DFP72DRAFT_1072123 [Tulosesus angulatus]